MKIKALLTAALLFAAGLTVSAQSVPAAATVMADAYKQAAKENKKVFLMFHASWCGWCHKMDAAMNEPELKPYFDKNFVIVHLTVMENEPEKKKLENPGALDMLKSYSADKDGIPMWYIYDGSGKLLADSKVRADGSSPGTAGGDNVGCPSAQKEVDFFTAILKKVTPLKDAELAQIAARFRKNDPAYKAE